MRSRFFTIILLYFVVILCVRDVPNRSHVTISFSDSPDHVRHSHSSLRIQIDDAAFLRRTAGYTWAAGLSGANTRDIETYPKWKSKENVCRYLNTRTRARDISIYLYARNIYINIKSD